MASLEDKLQYNFVQAREFLISSLNLSYEDAQRLIKTNLEFIVDKTMEDHARLEFSNNGQYALRFRPEAVDDMAAVGEESGHFARIILNDTARNNIFNAKKKSGRFIELIGLEEYFGRYAALAYLNYLGITKYNQLWSRFENNNITLLTSKPEDALSHYLGYTMAEKNYKVYGIQGLRDSIYNNDSSILKANSRKQMPKIVAIPLAA